MNYEQQPDALRRPEPPVLHNRILLLDGNSDSRDTRANALRSRGAIVDSVGNGADARSLWKPGSHDVVLIDFSGAGADLRDFYDYAHTARVEQKFGFYIATSPYLTTSFARYESARHEVPSPRPVERLQNHESRARVDNRYRTGVPEAARRIAAAKLLSRPVALNEQAAPRGISFADAVKNAQRVLDVDNNGSTKVD